MRRMIILAGVVVLCAGMVRAQKTCPAKTLAECPETGCGSWDPEFDRKRNLTADPKARNPRPMTLDEIRALKYPERWSLGKDRAELEKLGEGTLVQVTAYLISVEHAGATSANCRLADRWAGNVILFLASTPARSKKTSSVKESPVTAEVTARVRREHTRQVQNRAVSNWTSARLGALIKQTPKLIRITGLLLLDTETIHNPQQRSTDWQIHPILEFEVCEKKRNACVNDADWRKLDALQISVVSEPLVPRKNRIRTTKR